MSTIQLLVALTGLTILGAAVGSTLVLLIAERSRIRRERWDREHGNETTRGEKAA